MSNNIITPEIRASAAFQSCLNTEIVKALKIAKVIVKINKADFRNILYARNGDTNTVAEMVMQEDHTRVRLGMSAKAGATTKQSLFIKPGGATIRFKIVSVGEPDDEFVPLSIAFIQVSGADQGADGDARIGRLNFLQSQIRADDQFLYVTDSFKDKDGDDKFKFSILIQRKRDGAIGIFDPGIEHEQ